MTRRLPEPWKAEYGGQRTKSNQCGQIRTDGGSTRVRNHAETASASDSRRFVSKGRAEVGSARLCMVTPDDQRCAGMRPVLRRKVVLAGLMAQFTGTLKLVTVS